ncbi:MAG: nucleotide sugar dehydrogenase, partial [Planctomycetota bacterium]
AIVAESGFKVVVLDIDQNKIDILNRGKSYIDSVSSERITNLLGKNLFNATADFKKLRNTDVIVICVPTPLGDHREPDLSAVESTTRQIQKTLRREQIVILESTTYPGTTEEILLPILEESGLKCGKDFYLAFSPEREDPGNKFFNTKSIPKIVSGVDKKSSELALLFYSSVVDKVVAASSARVAEAVKITENIYRAVNIALVNELKVIFAKIGIDIWEVIELAKTKPFGFQAFYPGPGLGGHCIPIDPFYLTWKAREFGHTTKFIELAGEINTAMPNYVVELLIDALNKRKKPIKDAKILVLGVAYKSDIDDTRESPALSIISLLQKSGAVVRYYDPFVDKLPSLRHYPKLKMKSVKLTKNILNSSDAVVIVTNHSCVDYDFIVRHSHLVIDTRNATSSVKKGRGKVLKA